MHHENAMRVSALVFGAKGHVGLPSAGRKHLISRCIVHETLPSGSLWPSRPRSDPRSRYSLCPIERVSVEVYCNHRDDADGEDDDVAEYGDYHYDGFDGYCCCLGGS